ncbi:MAG: hypothetical protein QMD50_01080 [Patescibacteria group bacterium]|nr:hypothetical protein [Patescibacteria group bacterium]
MNEDKIIQKLLEHDKQFDKLDNKITDIVTDIHGMKDVLVTKSEFSEFRNQVSTTQDKIVTILERLDHERIFSAKWVERVESEIQKIKQVLKI